MEHFASWKPPPAGVTYNPAAESFRIGVDFNDDGVKDHDAVGQILGTMADVLLIKAEGSDVATGAATFRGKSYDIEVDFAERRATVTERTQPDDGRIPFSESRLPGRSAGDSTQSAALAPAGC